jgi:hypothetical protein
MRISLRAIPVLAMMGIGLAGCSQSGDSGSSPAVPATAGPNQVVLQVEGMT